MPNLFDGDDPEETLSLRVNPSYKATYETQKRREELRHLNQKYDDETSTDDDDDDEEDSDAELLTRPVHLKLLETLSKIRNKDPEVYDPNYVAFSENDFTSSQEPKRCSQQPQTYAQFMSATLLKEGPEAFVREEEKLNQCRAPNKSYQDEQEALKKAFKQAANEALVEQDDFLQASSEPKRGDNDEGYRQFVQSQARQNQDSLEMFSHYLQDDDALDEKERFLRDYVLFEGWKGKTPEKPVVESQEDEEHELVADQFEAGYNFRFEENPDICIEGHARRILDSVRRKDNQRRLKRQLRAERKSSAKKQREAELAQLKKLKQQEILERLNIIQRVAGYSKPIEAERLGLDKDFDPEQHDATMNALFSQDYEQQRDDNEADLFSEPLEQLAGLDDLKAPVSKRQRKKLELISKKAQRYAMRCGQDDGEAYAPVDDGGDALSQPSKDACDHPTTVTLVQSSVGDTTASANEDADSHYVWYKCDGCEMGIPERAKRFDCTVCENYTLCKQCFRCIRHPHKLHAHRVPVGCQPPLETDELHQEEQPKSYPFVEKALEEYYSLDYEDMVGGMPVRFKYRQTIPVSCGLSSTEILTMEDQVLNKILPFKRLAPYRSGSVKIGHGAKKLLSQLRSKARRPQKHRLRESQPKVAQRPFKKLKPLKDAPEGLSDAQLEAYGFRRG